MKMITWFFKTASMDGSTESFKRKIFALTSSIFLLWCSTSFAEDKLTIGVAANFMLPFEEIAREFENKSTIKIDAVYLSTGNLYGQIIHGAPYDLFLAADESRPERLVKQGLASDIFIYARGRVVLWTAKKQLCNAGDWQKALMRQGVNKVAIANPETAPYGTAAIKALKTAGLEQVLEKKFVFAQNVVQAFQYAHTESVDVGFCALSSAFSEHGKRGCYFPVDQAPIIVQKACIIRSTKKRQAVERFVTFLCSSEAQTVKKKYGYE